MVICPACGASNSDTREYCLGCMGDLPATGAVDRAAGESTVPSPGDSNEESAATASPSEIESLAIPGSACPRHADMPVAGTCVRCGTFFCAQCVESVLGENIECPSCLESKEAREAPASVKASIREQWGMLALLGLLFGGIGFAAVIADPERFSFDSDQTHLLLALFNGVVMSLPFVIAALLVGLVRRMWAVWMAYVIEILMFVLIVFTSFGLNCATAVVICASVWSLSRILKLAELVKKYPSALAASRNA